MKCKKLVTLSECIFSLVLTVAVLTAPLLNAANAAKDNATAEHLMPIHNNRIEVPLESVLVLALKNNLDITFASLQPDISVTEIAREQSQYDTLLTSQFSKYRDRKQVGNALTGSSSKTAIYTEQFDFDVALKKKFTPGTMAELTLSHEEFQSDLPFLGLRPQYSGEVMLSLTQPLLRDFGIEIGRSLIKIAKLNHEVSEHEFRKHVMDILFQVESYYWDLYFSIEDLKSKEKSLQAAEDLLREFKIRIDAGTLAPIEIYQAEAEVALRREDIIVAEHMVKQAEDNLKASLNLYDDERYWNTVIVPVDEPEKNDIHPDITNSIATALEKRPDFIQAKLNISSANIQVKYAKNQTLPRVDLIGSIGSNGLAGRPQDTTGAFGPFFRSSPSPWSGHWDDVYDGLGDDDYYSYMIGVKIEFPLENRFAKSQHSRAKVQAAQSIINLKNIENQIINEVRDAVRQIGTTIKVIDAATASLRLAREKLKAEQKKFKVGMSTTHDVLEFQEELASAESVYVRAKSEHRKALANFSRILGTLLEEKGLTL